MVARINLVEDKQSLLSKFYNGQCSLGKSFWIGFILMQLGIQIAFGVIMLAFMESDSSAVLAIHLMISTVAILSYNIMATIGTWRSATKHTETTGKRFMSYAAKIYISLTVASTVVSIAISVFASTI